MKSTLADSYTETKFSKNRVVTETDVQILAACLEPMARLNVASLSL